MGYVERVLDQLITPAPAEAEANGNEKKQEEKGNNNSNSNSKAKRAYFSTNACNPKDAPQSLEEASGTQHLLKLELPSVGHEAMDAEHAQLEGLMRAALESKKASDVASLKAMFAAHAKEEEELMKQSSFGESGEVSKISV